jgi:hypothetical protein
MHTTVKLSLVETGRDLMLLLLITCSITNALAAPSTSRARAIAIVRSIINRNATSCRINKTNSITAVASGRNWGVTARIVMSASGSPVNETAVWTVRPDGVAVPGNQLTAEISNGCP